MIFLPFYLTRDVADSLTVGNASFRVQLIKGLIFMLIPHCQFVVELFECGVIFHHRGCPLFAEFTGCDPGKFKLMLLYIECLIFFRLILMLLNELFSLRRWKYMLGYFAEPMEPNI